MPIDSLHSVHRLLSGKQSRTRFVLAVICVISQFFPILLSENVPSQANLGDFHVVSHKHGRNNRGLSSRSVS